MCDSQSNIKQMVAQWKTLDHQPYQLWSWLIVAILMMLVVPTSWSYAQSDTDTDIITIGFYGEESDPAADALRLAIEQINSEDGFTDVDGVTYTFAVEAATDPQAFVGSDAVAVIALPQTDDPSTNPPALWDMPVFLLDSDAPLTLPNVQAAIYRGMTSREQLDAMQIDFLIRQVGVQRAMFIGGDWLAAVSAINQIGSVQTQQRPDSLLTRDEFQSLLDYNPQAIFYQGDPTSANTLLSSLAANNWIGYFIYPDVAALIQEPEFEIPTGVNVIRMAHWDTSATDAVSVAFTTAFRTAYEASPSAQAVVAYDLAWAIRLLTERYGTTAGDLLLNFPDTSVIRTSSGAIDPASYGTTELYRSGMVIRYATRAERSVLARYDAGVIVPTETTVAALPTATPIPTATPSQYTYTVTSAFVNARQGPGSEYATLGQLQQGEIVVILGQLRNGNWYLAQTLWGPAWINASGGEVFDPQIANVIPEVAAPPPPTPTIPPATPTLAPIEVTATPLGTLAAGAPIVANTSVNLGGQINGYGNVPMMRTAGMTWVKEQVRWERGETADKAARGAVEAARTNNMKILIGSVGWNYEMLQAGSLDAYFAEFADYLRGVAALGPDAIEVWNEPNLDREWLNGEIDGGTYTRLLRVAYDAIKSVNPNVMVISAAPAPTGFFAGGCTAQGCDDDVFLRQMAAAGAANYMDCIGAHFNEGVVSPSATTGDPRGSHHSYYLPTLMSIYRSIFNDAKPLCFTEIGYVTDEGLSTALPASFGWAANNTLQGQADFLSEAVRVLRSSGRVEMIIIWNVNFTGVGDDPRGAFAIIRPDGSCPACPRLAEAAQ